jgi:hypothetical protein
MFSWYCTTAGPWIMHGVLLISIILPAHWVAQYFHLRTKGALQYQLFLTLLGLILTTIGGICVYSAVRSLYTIACFDSPQWLIAPACVVLVLNGCGLWLYFKKTMYPPAKWVYIIACIFCGLLFAIPSFLFRS